MSDKIYIDFEYNQTNEKNINLVCCSFSENLKKPYSIWLFNNDKAKKDLKEILIDYRRKGFVFVSYSVMAEARAFIALGINPILCTWIDLYLEYRMLTNHNHDLQYGKQLINGAKVRTSPPKPFWETSEEDKKEENNSKPSHSLAACCYKLLGVQIDTVHKQMMVNLIISNPFYFSDEDQKKIMEYCESDIKYLPEVLNKEIENYKKLLPTSQLRLLPKEIYLRGEYAARTALMENVGYPINLKAAKNFSGNVPNILKDLAEDINSLFEFKVFKWDKKLNRYSMQVKKIQDWIKTLPFASSWQLTDTGKPSTALEAFTRHFDYSHDYPRDLVGAQIVRYLKTRQALNGFLPKTAKSKNNFFDSVGSDSRSRPYFGIYGAQSGRSQPKATGFIPLKAAWMRVLIEPNPGMALCSIDYKSQEFLISALVSRDKNMFLAYRSGDVYLYFAKLVGAVPKDGKREDYEEERNLFKSTTLGISYNMGAKSLAKKLTLDTGKEYTEEDAQNLIDYFKEAFPRFSEWNESNLEDYKEREYIKLPCGWYMFGDNDNWRSVNNVPIQGFGSSIMRKAVALAQDSKLRVVYTLHDSLVIEYPSFNYKYIDKLLACMREGFIHYFKGNIKRHAGIIGLDVDTWSPDYKDGVKFTPNGAKIQCYNKYIDKRALPDYNRFKKYF